MTFLARDKALHFWLSHVAVFISYFVLSFLGFLNDYKRRIGVSVVLILILGCIKELGDGFWWSWPWCPPCTADVGDVTADVFGVVTAGLGLVLYTWSWRQWIERTKPVETITTETTPVPAEDVVEEVVETTHVHGSVAQVHSSLP
jgi:hypothetical protein